MDELVPIFGYAIALALSGLVLRMFVAFLRAPIDIPRAARAGQDLAALGSIAGFSPTASIVNRHRRGVAVDLVAGKWGLLLGNSSSPTPRVFSHSKLRSSTVFYGKLVLTFENPTPENYGITDLEFGDIMGMDLLLQTFVSTSYHKMREAKYEPAHLTAIEAVRSRERGTKHRDLVLASMLAFLESPAFRDGEYIIASYDFQHTLTNFGIWSVDGTGPNVVFSSWADIVSVTPQRSDDADAPDFVLELGSGQQRILNGWVEGAAMALQLIANTWKADPHNLERWNRSEPLSTAQALKTSKLSSIGLRQCPRCRTKVLPLSDGSCPGCHTVIP